MAKSSRVAFIIPGYRFSPKRPEYKAIARAFAKQGIAPVGISVMWKNRTMSQYIVQVEKIIQAHPAKQKYMLGFSFGAYISFVLSTRIKVKQQFLCSLSPYFAEDVQKIKKSWKEGLGKQRMQDFKNFSYRALSPKVTSPTLMFYGDQEVPEVRRTVRAVYQKLKIKKKLLLFTGAKHRLSQPNIYSRFLSKLGP